MSGAPNPMVEKVARAICRRITRHGYPLVSEPELSEMVENSWQEPHWIEAARAAVTALREPTEAMLNADHKDRIDGANSRPQYEARAAWESMIDKVLEHA